MVKLILEDRWTLLADWNGWDLERSDGTKLEVKQSAARQPWSEALGNRASPACFDIAPRKGYWTNSGAKWVEQVGRYADVYVFAHHPVFDAARCDQRDPSQWQFWLLSSSSLPPFQKQISLGSLIKLGATQADSENLPEEVQRLLQT